MTVRTEFVPWDRPSPLLDRLGDFSRHRSDRGVFGFEVDEPKLNARGFAHAGAISTIADVCIGHTLARTTNPPTSLLTASLNTTFLGVVRAGAWVVVLVDVDRVGRRLAAGTATFAVSGRVVARSSGLFLPAEAQAAGAT